MCTLLTFQMQRIILTFNFIFRRAISSFKAVDLDDSHNLNIKELTTLLWLCNGEEPSEQRAKTEHSLMDLDNDGVIDFREWIKYLIIPSDGSSTHVNYKYIDIFRKTKMCLTTN